MALSLLFLLIWVKVKHFLADYILQGEYMLGKFLAKGWIMPLASHCAVHAIFTLTMCLFFVRFEFALGLALLDFGVHFVVDRLKASPNYGGRFKSMTKADYNSHSLLYKSVYKDYFDGKISADEYVSLTKEVESFFQQKKKSNRMYWLTLGFDQLLHGVTDLVIIFLMLGVR